MTDQKRISIIEVVALVVFGVVLAAIGPFGTFVLADFPERLIYWTVLMLLSFAAYRPAYAWAGRLAPRLRLPLLLLRTAAVALASVPMTLLVWFASYRHTPSLWPTPVGYVDLYGSVLLVGGMLTLGFWLVEQLARDAPGASADAPLPSPGRDGRSFMERVPVPHHGGLIALEMEDHYLRVHMERGSALILMRLRDALAQLDDEEGLQVHRSWWVARGAVQKIHKEGRSVKLVLSNVLTVPVARERVAQLRSRNFGAL